MGDARSKLLAVLVVGALGVSACGSDDGDDSAEPAGEESEAVEDEAPVDCDPSLEVDDASIDGAQQFEFEGDERSYLLTLPDDYDGSTAHPLVFNFHGFGANKEEQEEYTAMGELGAARGYVVVTPDALGDPSDWNYFSDEARPDDFGFIDALVTDLTDRVCIDSDRIYAAGHSAGSAFTGFLACAGSTQFAGVAMVAAFIPPTCPADQALAVMGFHGIDDPGVPYDGGSVGDSSIGIPAALDTFDQYGEHYQCEPAVETEAAADVELRTLTGCAHGNDVAFYSLVGGGHGWPGNTFGVDLGGLPGNPVETFPATETILDFFDEHAG